MSLAFLLLLTIGPSTAEITVSQVTGDGIVSIHSLITLESFMLLLLETSSKPSIKFCGRLKAKPISLHLLLTSANRLRRS